MLDDTERRHQPFLEWHTLRFFIFKKKKSNVNFCHPDAPSVVIPAQAGIHCAAGISLVTPVSGFIPLSPRGPGPARRVAWVDADTGVQVIGAVA